MMDKNLMALVLALMVLALLTTLSVVEQSTDSDECVAAAIDGRKLSVLK